MAIELKQDMMKESEYGKGGMDIDFRALNSQMKALEELRDGDIFLLVLEALQNLQHQRFMPTFVYPLSFIPLP